MNPHIQKHPFAPFFDTHSQVLILGSFPSPDSKSAGFYYQNKHNRFWEIMECVFETKDLQGNIANQKAFLTKHHIALWDIIESCQIEGAKDESIKNPTSNDLDIILSVAPIRQIFTTGSKAFMLAHKFYPHLHCIKLTSSSKRTQIQGYTTQRLSKQYRQIKEVLDS